MTRKQKHPTFHLVLLAFFICLLFQHCAKGTVGNICGDGICRGAENHENCPEDCIEPGCGNGIIELGEECDGIHLDGKTCTDLGFATGSLRCSDTCEFDISLCRTTCNNNCPAAGSTRCVGNYLETCTENNQTCLEWVQTVECTTLGQICDDSSGSGQCMDTCSDACTLSDRRCIENMLQSCENGENGCTQWKNLQDCAATNWICSGSGAGTACTDPCNHDCPLGAPDRCEINTVQSCGPDTNGCRVWNNGTDCTTIGQVCSNGTCTCVHECTAGSTRCLNSLRQQCSTNAHGCRIWETVQDCTTTGQVCDTVSGSAQCVFTCTDTCADGAVRCSGNTIQHCQLTGTGCRDWVDGTNCATTDRSCSNGTCVCNHSCSSGQVRCEGDMAQNCTVDAYGCFKWTNHQNCASLGQVCLNGTCQTPATGYTCEEIANTYTSIRWTGTPMATTTYELDVRYGFTIPFTFRFYGMNYTTGWLCSNGWVSFGADPGVNTYSNTTLPNPDLPNAAIYPFWDDLVFSTSTWPDAQMLYRTTGSSPNRVFTLEWYQLRALGTGTDHRAIFQVKLYEGTNNFEVIFDRGNWLGSTFSATIGFENGNGTDGVDAGTEFTGPPVSNYRCTPL